MISPKEKIYDSDTLRTQTDLWKSNGEQVVFTNGCFDILHEGHLGILQYSRAQGDRLIVALNDDASVRKLKGVNRPVNDEKLRSEIMASLYYVDAVVLFGEDTPLGLIESVQPHIIVKGGDYKPEEVVGAEIVQRNGGKVLIFEYQNGHSTTQIIDRIKKEN